MRHPLSPPKEHPCARRLRGFASLRYDIAPAPTTAECDHALITGACPSATGEDNSASAPESEREAQRVIRSATASMPLGHAAQEADEGLDAKSTRARGALLARGSGLKLTIRDTSAIKRALSHTAPTGLRIDPASQGCRRVCRSTSGGVRPEDYGQLGTLMLTVLSVVHRHG